MKNKIEKIGILGGTFDPAHRGHVAISKEAKNRFGLKKIYWAVTKKNPFKIKTSKNLIERIKYAKKISKHIGTDHTELYITPRQALEVNPNLPNLYCEPFADSSQIPTFIVSKLAKEKVTVALSGDGADEIYYEDTVASLYGRNNLQEVVSKTAKQISIPLVVGGGLRSIEDIKNGHRIPGQSQSWPKKIGSSS